MTETSTRRGVVRTRRYVSAPAGTYPAPVPAVLEAEEVPASIPEDPPARAATPGPPPVAPISPPEAPAGTGESTPGTAEGTSREEAAVVRSPGWGGVLLGALVGTVIGVSLGMILVAFFGGCEPSLAWTDPLAVWRTVTDPVIRFSGMLVAAGCALLGAALGGRRPAASPED